MISKQYINRNSKIVTRKSEFVNKMLSCVIIDDEPLAREGLASYVREVDFLQLTGTCENPLDLVKLMDKNQVDLIFLDIQMPKMNGIILSFLIPQLKKSRIPSISIKNVLRLKCKGQCI